MEIFHSDDFQTRINPGQTRELGRGNGFDSSDKTISRRLISFSVPQLEENPRSVQFEVIGKNPVWVHDSKNDEVKAYRRFERGEMESGDMFCVSSKNPVWFTMRKSSKIVRGNEIDNGLELEKELDGDLEESTCGLKGVEDLNTESVDILSIDPVKEFGFLVIGHEFDSYSKKMIRDIKNWDWFLDELGKDIEEYDDDEKKAKGRGKNKRKKGKENDDDDEEWTGESEDEKEELINKPRKAQKNKYVTRSKDRVKINKNTEKRKSSTVKKDINIDYNDENDEDEDEEDETLGGFIVEDENEDEIGDLDEEEEEELEEEFDEDE